MPRNDAISVLEQDHAQVRALLRKVTSGSPDEADLRELAQLIDAHAAIEREIFYPAFRAAAERDDDRRLGFEALEEHRVVDVLIRDVDEAKGEPLDRAARLDVLAAMLDRHLEEEEQQMFPRVRALCEETTLDELGERMRARRAELIGEAPRGGAERAARGGAERATGGGIDLNRASEEELMSIEGIDGVRARILVEHRPYRSWEDVQSVEGIGETLLEKIRDRATFGGRK